MDRTAFTGTVCNGQTIPNVVQKLLSTSLRATRLANRQHHVAMPFTAACNLSLQISDAFGLKLGPSSTSFWTKDIPSAYQGPSVSSGIALLEVAERNKPLQ